MIRSQTSSNSSILHEAWRFYRRRRYREALLVLQRLSSGPRSTFYPDYLSALCMLHLDHYDRALEIITRASRDYPGEAVFAEMTSYLHLKSADSGESFTATLVQLGLTDRSLRIRRLFECAIRSDDFIAFQRRTRISECVTRIPPPFEALSLSIPFLRKKSGRNGRSRFRAAFVAIPAVLIIAAALAYLAVNSLRFSAFSGGDTRGSAYDSLFAEDDSALRRYPAIEIAAGKAAYVYATPDSLFADYDLARRRVKSGDGNGGLIIVNRIMNSNASVQLRERAAFIKKFILAQQDRKVSRVRSEELLRDPLLYNGSLLYLQGKAANVRTKNDATTMNLLVGAVGDKFECMAEVIFREAVSVKEGENVEIEVIFLHAIDEGNVLVVEGVGITSGGGT